MSEHDGELPNEPNIFSLLADHFGEIASRVKAGAVYQVNNAPNEQNPLILLANHFDAVARMSKNSPEKAADSGPNPPSI